MAEAQEITRWTEATYMLPQVLPQASARYQTFLVDMLCTLNAEAKELESVVGEDS